MCYARHMISPLQRAADSVVAVSSLHLAYQLLGIPSAWHSAGMEFHTPTHGIPQRWNTMRGLLMTVALVCAYEPGRIHAAGVKR